MPNPLQAHRLYSPWNSPGQNTGVGSISLLQGIFPTQGSNPGLLHCRQILYHLSHKGSPRILEWVTYPFSSGSSPPRNWTGVSCIAGRFFTNWAIREALIAKENDQTVILSKWRKCECMCFMFMILRKIYECKAFLVAQMVKNLPMMQETCVWSLGQKDPLEEKMTTISSILAWEIPWTEEPGGLQYTGLWRVGHNWATNTFIEKNISYEKSDTSERYGNNHINDLYAFPNFYLMNLHCLQKENQENLHWLDCCLFCDIS